MTLAYFCLGGLDLLGYFAEEEDENRRKTREGWIEWVWEMQARQYAWLLAASRNNTNSRRPQLREDSEDRLT